MSRFALAIVAFLIAGGTAAAAPLPDRSGLSYDENVIINSACFKARQKNDGAFNDCVQKQIAALKAHPTPDRSALSAAQNRTIEDKCEFYRRVGIADYNDCVTAVMATQSAQTSKDPGVASN
jgi:hypothetical protein